MSKERARRRAEREAAAEAARLRAQAEDRRRQRARRRRDAVTSAVPKPRFLPGILAARRRRQNAAIAAGFIAVQAAVWALLGSPAWSLLALAISALLTPVAVTLIFDRRN